MTAIYYQGEPWRVRIETAAPGVRRSSVRGAHGELHVLVAPRDRRRVRAVLRQRLRRYAREVIADEVSRWAEHLALSVRGISIRDQRSRWGSCSGRSHLSFNWRLVMAPPPTLRYVVLHELTHLLEPNHSRRFWDRLAAVCPDVEEQKRWLRRHGARLMTW